MEPSGTSGMLYAPFESVSAFSAVPMTNTWTFASGAPLWSRTWPVILPVLGLVIVGAAAVEARASSISRTEAAVRWAVQSRARGMGCSDTGRCSLLPWPGGYVVRGCGRWDSHTGLARGLPLPSSFHQEKSLQQVATLLGHKASHHLRPVIGPGVPEQVVHRAGHSAAGIIGAEDHAPDLAQHDGAGALGAGLQGDVQGGKQQPVFTA